MFEKKIVFTGIITFVPFVTDKVKLKLATRIINIMERRKHAGGTVYVVFCTVLRFTVSCQVTDHVHKSYLVETSWTNIHMLTRN